MVILTAMISMMGLDGCTWFEKPAPTRTFSEVNLLIELSDMPERWAPSDSAPKHDADEGEVNSAYRNFYIPDAPYLIKAGEDVNRYEKIGLADWNYKLLQKKYFTPTYYTTSSWETPDDLHFTSSSAKQWRFACAYSIFSPAPEMGKQRKNCLYLAQYEEFIVNFGITTEVDQITFVSTEEIVSILEKVDARMTFYLQSDHSK